jgi:hypothetical protein
MKEPTPNFSEQIEAHKNAETVPDTITTLESAYGSRLSVRSRGCFITNFSVEDQKSGDSVPILYSDEDLSVAKLTASHTMTPVGPSKELGGQHGFARWADYHLFPQMNGAGERRNIAFQAERSDLGQGVTKQFELETNRLVIVTEAFNYEPEPLQTSLGEHLYFSLPGENIDGLKLNGSSLDESFGEGIEASVMSGEPFFWDAFYGRSTKIEFPDGRQIMLSAVVPGKSEELLGMLIWHRTGSPSICFEPTVGFRSGIENSGLEIAPYDSTELVTLIEVSSIGTPSERLIKKIALYLDSDHIEFLEQEAMDFEDTLSYIYGALIESGYSPDEVLSELGYSELDEK